MADRRRQVPEIDGAALAELPIFPLPDIVLFPSELLPLHVFEERYRDLTRDAIEGHRVIAMTRLRPNEVHSDSELPEVFPIAGLGLIEAVRETEDGRYLILLRGVGRIAIREELPLERSYRRVRAALVPDVPSQRPELVSACAQQLVSLCERLADAFEASDLRDLVRAAETPGERADVVSAAVVSDPDERQKLLETLDPADRLDRLLELVAETMANLGVERQLN